jgi:hypothetical protein
MSRESDPVLIREVEVPRPRPQGFALVAVTFLSLFAALGTCAFALRVRMLAHQRAALSDPVAPVDVDAVDAEVAPPANLDAVAAAAPVAADVAGEIVPVSLITPDEARALAEQALDERERAQVERFRVTAATDPEGALAQWDGLAAGGNARRVLRDEREALADDWLATQLSRLERELDRRDCGAVNERLARMQRILPDRRLPHAMDGCPR